MEKYNPKALEPQEQLSERERQEREWMRKYNPKALDKTANQAFDDLLRGQSDVYGPGGIREALRDLRHRKHGLIELELPA